ncbi:MAG TPA: hypothetical protein VI039_13030 [Solirubrobacterales bacterium]
MSEQNGAAAEPKEIVRVEPKALSHRDPFKIAGAFAASKLFPGLTLEAAVVKIIAGEELGIGPMAAIKGIDVIKGNIGYRGNLVATLVKQHDSYEYAVLERTNDSCTLQFLVDGKPAPGDAEGKSTFSLEDAERAGLMEGDNWKNYPRAMCFNRALTEGVRAYIPDVTAGVPAYTDDEIREVITVEAEAEVDEGAQDALPEERVAELLDLWKKVEPIFEADQRNVNALDGLNFMLGSLGIDGFEPADHTCSDRGGIANGLAGLTPEEAEQVEAEFTKTLEQATTSTEATHADA